ncbi:YbgC/FadM family acyl-CoA thioesterase [Sphingorhabdus sp. EL138]|uniref:YbgC/FadM family acyl-CoA thioesterase n=1 Tax=Sphingorhabdus sp. EL138 TaxID=2073156 RepID=UPI0020B12DEA|nr:YbgC/FadM family acyl-CoA thioesterase [Sphingorhabdus sp. EL138]
MTNVPKMDATSNLPSDIKPHEGEFRDHHHYYACRVYYEDTDFSGIVYHANYLKFMERARSDMLHQLGMDQRAAFEADDGAYAVVDMHIKYIAPAKFQDNLLVISQVSKLRKASVNIEQIIMRGDEKIASASVQAAFLTPTGRPRRQPEAWTNAFASVIADDEEQN